jgi:hypothetical protein
VLPRIGPEFNQLHEVAPLPAEHPKLNGYQDSEDSMSVTLWPNSDKLIPELTAGIDAVTRRKLLAGNADRVFHFSAAN